MWWLDKRKAVDLDARQRILDLEEQVQRLVIGHRQVQAAYDELQGAHAKLRSKFYGTLGASQAPSGGAEHDSKTVDWVAYGGGPADTLALRPFRSKQ